MRKVKILLSVAILFFLTAAVLTVSLIIKSRTNVTQKAAAGSKIYITPATQLKSPGNDVSLAVAMDTNDSFVTGLDLLVKFNPSVLEITSIKKGVGVEALNNTISNSFDNTKGEISYAIFTLDKSQAVKGSSIEVLQVNAKVRSDAPNGNSTISFDSSSAVSATGENQSVLTLTVPGTVVVQGDTPTITPTPTTPPTNAPGSPNSCGGTCGSNANCGSNLFCYQGYCRNPSCSWSTDCSCNITATPTPTRTPTPRPASTTTTVRTTRPTQSPVVVIYTPSPEATPEDDNFWEDIFDSGSGVSGPTPTIEPSEIAEGKVPNYLPWIIGSLVVAGITLVLIVIGIIKEINRGKNKPPVINV